MRLSRTENVGELWNHERDGEPNEEWIRPEIFIKTEEPTRFMEYRTNLLCTSVKEILRNLETSNILKSFYFTYQPKKDAEGRFEFDPASTYFPTMLDFSIWAERPKEAEQIIESELNKRDDMLDFGFWLFPTKHSSYSSDPDLFYNLICKIYEVSCRFLLEKLDSDSPKNLRGTFRNLKIVHVCNNQQGMNPVDEAFFAMTYAIERMKFLHNYWGVPLGDIMNQLYDVSRNFNLRILECRGVNYYYENLQEGMWNTLLYFPLHVVEANNGRLHITEDCGSGDRRI